MPVFGRGFPTQGLYTSNRQEFGQLERTLITDPAATPAKGVLKAELVAIADRLHATRFPRQGGINGARPPATLALVASAGTTTVKVAVVGTRLQATRFPKQGGINGPRPPRVVTIVVAPPRPLQTVMGGRLRPDGRSRQPEVGFRGQVAREPVQPFTRGYLYKIVGPRPPTRVGPLPDQRLQTIVVALQAINDRRIRRRRYPLPGWGGRTFTDTVYIGGVYVRRLGIRPPYIVDPSGAPAVEPPGPAPGPFPVPTPTPTATPLRTPTAGTLGCGDYQVLAFNRGDTKTLLAELPVTSLEWGRVVDDTSQATITIGGSHQHEGCSPYGFLRPWRHEIAIYRGGHRVWVGPIYQARFKPDRTLQITARDRSAWWDRRFIHRDHFYTATDLATIFNELVIDAMEPDNSPGVYVIATKTLIAVDYQVLAAQRQKAGSVLRDIGRYGLDWTAVDSTVLAGGIVVPTAPIGLLTDGDFAVLPEVVFDGASQANSVVVSGAGTGAAGNSIEGVASDRKAIADDGLLEDSDTILTIQDKAGATAAANSHVALFKNSVNFDAAVLAPTAPISIDRLVPGAIAQLELAQAGPEEAGGFWRLQSIRVTVSEQNEENVTPVFQPIGTARVSLFGGAA